MPSRARMFRRFAGALACILIMHLSALFSFVLVGASVVAAFGAFVLATIFVDRDTRHRTAVGLAASVLALIGLMVLVKLGWDGAEIFYLPPILITGYVAFIFGRTLLPGREPLITRFRRLEWGEVSAPLARYTKVLTVSWTLLMTAMTIEVAVLAVLLDLETWSWYANVLNPLIAVAFFGLEHIYRFWRYGGSGEHSLWRTFKVLMRRESWTLE